MKTATAYKAFGLTAVKYGNRVFGFKRMEDRFYFPWFGRTEIAIWFK